MNPRTFKCSDVFEWVLMGKSSVYKWWMFPCHGEKQWVARTVSVGPGLFGGKARGDGVWKTCPSKASCWFLACHVAMPKCQNIPEMPQKPWQLIQLGALRKRLLTGSRVSPGSNLKQGIWAPLCEGLKVQPVICSMASLVWSHPTQYTHLTLW